MDLTALSGNITTGMGAAAAQGISMVGYVAGVGGIASGLAERPKENDPDPELTAMKRTVNFFRLGALLAIPFMAAAAQGSVAGATPSPRMAPARLPAFTL